MDYYKLLYQITEVLIQENGSDIHISMGRHPILRVNTVLREIDALPVLTAADTVGLLEMMLSEKQQEYFGKHHDIDFSYSVEDSTRFRGNASIESGAPAIALRRIANVIPTLEELRLPPILAEITKQKQGFFLVVGPVGQGKSTTLASMVDHINERRVEHILTIEDPIEYIFNEKRSIIHQRQVESDTEGFSQALKGMFRQDVNVALIGEMRGPDTISAAVTAAETGHFVMSTLHTNNAAQTIHRIMDAFPAHQQAQIRSQLAASLTGIFSQRLIPRIDGGMVPAFELLVNTSAVSNLIRENRIHEIQAVIETGSDLGMVDMNRSLADLVRRGEITVEHAQRYSINPRGLVELL